MNKNTNRFDPNQVAESASGVKPAFITITFPPPRMEVAAGGPVGGSSVEEYIQLSLLPKELRDRVVLYIRETLRG